MTTAIRNAASSNTVIYFPAGTYLTNEIYYTSNQLFYGDGINKTIIKLANSQDTPLFTRSDAIMLDDWPTVNALAQMDNVEIRDMTLDGNQSGQTTPISTDFDYVVYMQRIIVCRVANLEVKNGRTGGITLRQCR
ncbi:MAG: glycosyl hydrolase family 28-related protein, partial [Planctomycetota bacterium]